MTLVIKAICSAVNEVWLEAMIDVDWPSERIDLMVIAGWIGCLISW